MVTPDVESIIQQARQLAADDRRRLLAALAHDTDFIAGTGDTVNDLSQELRWVDENRKNFAGQWVAVRGNRLISHGLDGREVYEAARKAGERSPFVTRVRPAEELPFAGW